MVDTKSKLTGEERKYAIIEAAIPVFARNGYNGTSIKKIAKAAKISEALIYKHFSGKGTLYRELLSYSADNSVYFLQGFLDIEPGTETLVNFVYSTVTQIIVGGDARNRFIDRLLFYSLLEDPDIVMPVYKKLADEFMDAIDISVQAALKCGDMVPMSVSPYNSFWFMNHLALALKMFHQSDQPAFEYQTTKEELVEDAILFILRGMGVTDSAIKKYFYPEKLDKFMKHMSDNKN